MAARKWASYAVLVLSVGTLVVWVYHAGSFAARDASTSLQFIERVCTAQNLEFVAVPQLCHMHRERVASPFMSRVLQKLFADLLYATDETLGRITSSVSFAGYIAVVLVGVFLLQRWVAPPAPTVHFMPVAHPGGTPWDTPHPRFQRSLPSPAQYLRDSARERVVPTASLIELDE